MVRRHRICFQGIRHCAFPRQSDPAKTEKGLASNSCLCGFVVHVGVTGFSPMVPTKD